MRGLCRVGRSKTRKVEWALKLANIAIGRGE
jgi:hypothetical protein